MLTSISSLTSLFCIKGKLIFNDGFRLETHCLMVWSQFKYLRSVNNKVFTYSSVFVCGNTNRFYADQFEH